MARTGRERGADEGQMRAVIRCFGALEGAGPAARRNAVAMIGQSLIKTASPSAPMAGHEGGIVGLCRRMSGAPA